MALGALLAPTMAADMKVKAPILNAPVAPEFNWTGCYLGGNAGGKWGRFREHDSADGFTFLGTPFPVDFANPGDANGNSFAVGGQLGCRIQTSQRWVFGIEGDLDGTDLTATQVVGDAGLTRIGTTFIPDDSFSLRARWQSSIKGSVGYASGHWLTYATGGVAFTRVDKDASYPATVSAGTAFPASAGSDSKTLTGFTVGVGAAYALGRNWDLGLEYRYTAYQHADFALGTVAGSCTPNACGFTPVTGSVDLQTHEVLARLNYRIDWLAPPLMSKH
jgi:outer membrane immunogenic protein